MKIAVSYSGMARSLAQTAAEIVELPPSSDLHQLLAEIARRHGERMSALLRPDDQGVPPVLVFVGDEQVAWKAPAPLKDRDQVMLVSPIAGG